MSVDTSSFKFVNTSWMQNGQAVWIQISPEVPLRK